ncbi:MAG: ABC transporter permease [Bacillota bacterium]
MIQSFKMALKSIAGSKMRSFLTMLGIIIGVVALVVLVSIANGATSSVQNTISGLGSNLLTVSVSDDKGEPIKMSTLDEWKNERGIGEIAPYAQANVTGKYGTVSDSVRVYGTTAAYADIQELSVELGRFLKTTDVENNSYVCVISKAVATELIGYEDCIGQEISFDGMKFTVVGVLEDDDSSLTSVFQSDTLVAYIPYTALMRLSTAVSSDITSFYVSAESGGTTDEADEAMTALLMNRFEQDDDAFEVTSQDALENTTSSITSVLELLLGGIAGISLIVGGIGIMNIMLVTVTERTREIGIRKAVGAGRGVILRQFLVEAVVICMMGCMMGIALSWIILQLITVVASSLSITFSLDGGVVLIAVAFCFFIGIAFGLYPANKAAKMKPIDALHYGG